MGTLARVILTTLLVLAVANSVACESLEGDPGHGEERLLVIPPPFPHPPPLPHPPHICETIELGLVNRTTFPPCFTFGMGTSDYQSEGASNEGGRGQSIWDVHMQNHPEIQDYSNRKMCDTYHRYKEDIAFMKDMGLDAYRFSISWTRVLPYGSLKGGVNEDGISFYNNFINELLANGVKPFVTLLHMDIPQALEHKYEGFLNKKIVDDFRDFAELCFERFGDRVKYWTTINEPWYYSRLGYATGQMAPGRCSHNCLTGNSGTEPYTVTHHQLLAHAAAVELYRRKYQMCQDGKIGITLNAVWLEPLRPHSIDDQLAVAREMDFSLGWFMEPLTTGDYPKSLRERVKHRLPKFNLEESKMLINAFDFIGLNYYYANYATLDNSIPPYPSYLTDAGVKLSSKDSNGHPIGEQAGSPWLYVYPKGIYRLLHYMKGKYNNPIIYISENGVNEKNDDRLQVWEAINDPKRMEYYNKHLCYVQQAIREGVFVRGFIGWALLDNFEWSSGHTVRFGVYYVDYKHGLARYPKHSATWFKHILQKNDTSNCQSVPISFGK